MRAVSQEIQGRTRRRTSLFSGPDALSVRNTIGLKGSENMKTPLTKERVKHHLTYHSWKYLMLVALSIMGWNLIYTTTAYRPPAEKIVDVYLCASYGDQEALDAYLENIRLTEDILRAQEGIYERRDGNCDLFVSVPFCPSKCVYCSFITADIRYTRKYLDEYMQKLCYELQSCASLTEHLRSVYVGGGTPLVLEPLHLKMLLDAVAPLRKNGCEYTVEAGRPDVFTDEKLSLLKEYGVTRICVNPQSLSDATLERIGRKHTAKDVYRAYEMAQKYGFDVNMDLIAGLTGESYEEFETSLREAIALDPDNITVHTLCLKAGAKLKEEHARLDGETVGRMVDVSRTLLRAAGYEPYYMYRQKYQAGNRENTGWTKPGKACVYNVDIMEEIADNLAVGANAVSKKVHTGENRIERYGSPKDFPTYFAKIEEVIAKKNKLFSE